MDTGSWYGSCWGKYGESYHLLISVTKMKAALILYVNVQQIQLHPAPPLSMTISQLWNVLADERIIVVMEVMSFHQTMLCSY